MINRSLQHSIHIIQVIATPCLLRLGGCRSSTVYLFVRHSYYIWRSTSAYIRLVSVHVLQCRGWRIVDAKDASVITQSKEPAMNCEHEHDLPWFTRHVQSLCRLAQVQNRFDPGFTVGRGVNIPIPWKNINFMDSQARHFGGRHLGKGAA